MRLIKLSSVILAFLLRAVEPFLNLVRRFYLLSKAQSKVNSSISITSQFDGDFQILGSGRISWGVHCRFGKDVVLETQGEGVIEIGDNVRINQGSVLVAYDKIIIGNDCLIGEYSSIRDANHGIGAGTLIRKQAHNHAPITIENDCWIARGVTILSGVHIQCGAVVGANSVVTHDVKQNTIVAGTPTKPIKMRR